MHVASEPIGRVKLEYTFRLEAPGYAASEWHVHVARAPSYAAQTGTTSSSRIEAEDHALELQPQRESDVRINEDWRVWTDQG